MAATTGRPCYQRLLFHSETWNTDRALLSHSKSASPWKQHSQDCPSTWLWRWCLYQVARLEAKRAYFGCHKTKASCTGLGLRRPKRMQKQRVFKWLKKRVYEGWPSFREIELMIISAQNLYPVSARHYEFPIFRGFTKIFMKLMFLCTWFTVFCTKSTFFEGVITVKTSDRRPYFQWDMSS